MSRHIAVIGGGISGLASAYRLSSRGHQVSVFESADTLGGLGTTFPYLDTHLERFYHCLLPSDHTLIALIQTLGLGSSLQWRHTSMGFRHRERLFSLNTAIDLLRFTPLRIDERLRLGLVGLVARYRGENPALDQLTAVEWLTTMVGQRAFEVLWKPLLAAKIGERYTDIPALWISSRLSREKNTKLESKGYLEGGYRGLVDALEAALVAMGVHIHRGAPVHSIRLASSTMVLTLTGNEEHFDTVISTAPLPTFQQMTRALELDTRVSDLSLDYQGAICGLLLSKQPLSRYYWMPFVECGATAQGVIEMSNLVPTSFSAGRHVNYFVNYTHRDSPLFRLDDDELLRRYCDDLRRLFPHATDSLVDQYLFRAPFVEPIWTVGYLERKPPMTLIPQRLYMACTAQLYPRVNSWNSCCEVVDEMINEFTGHEA